MNDLDTHTLHGGQRQLAREETCPVPCAYSNPSSPITTRGSSDESMLQLTKTHSQPAQNAAVMGLAPPQKASSSGPQSKGAWEPDSSTASLVCKEEPGLDNASTGMCSARPAQGGKRMLRGGGTSSFRGVTKHCVTQRWEAHLWDACAPRAKPAGGGGGGGQQARRTRGKQVYLGAYVDEQTAARAYDTAALAFFGKQAVLNFPLSDYQDSLAVLLSAHSSAPGTGAREAVVAELRRHSSGFARGLSRYRGVTKHHLHAGKWEARIGRVAGAKYLYLGTYEKEVDAARAYDYAVLVHKGMHAVTNFDKQEYCDASGDLLPQDRVPWVNHRTMPPATSLNLTTATHIKQESTPETTSQLVTEDTSQAASCQPGPELPPTSTTLTATSGVSANANNGSTKDTGGTAAAAEPSSSSGAGRSGQTHGSASGAEDAAPCSPAGRQEGTAAQAGSRDGSFSPDDHNKTSTEACKAPHARRTRTPAQPGSVVKAVKHAAVTAAAGKVQGVQAGVQKTARQHSQPTAHGATHKTRGAAAGRASYAGMDKCVSRSKLSEGISAAAGSGRQRVRSLACGLGKQHKWRATAAAASAAGTEGASTATFVPNDDRVVPLSDDDLACMHMMLCKDRAADAATTATDHMQADNTAWHSAWIQQSAWGVVKPADGKMLQPDISMQASRTAYVSDRELPGAASVPKCRSGVSGMMLGGMLNASGQWSPCSPAISSGFPHGGIHSSLDGSSKLNTICPAAVWQHVPSHCAFAMSGRSASGTTSTGAAAGGMPSPLSAVGSISAAAGTAAGTGILDWLSAAALTIPPALTGMGLTAGARPCGLFGLQQCLAPAQLQGNIQAATPAMHYQADVHHHTDVAGCVPVLGPVMRDLLVRAHHQGTTPLQQRVLEAAEAAAAAPATLAAAAASMPAMHTAEHAPKACSIMGTMQGNAQPSPDLWPPMHAHDADVVQELMEVVTDGVEHGDMAWDGVDDPMATDWVQLLAGGIDAEAMAMQMAF